MSDAGFDKNVIHNDSKQKREFTPLELAQHDISKLIEECQNLNDPPGVKNLFEKIKNIDFLAYMNPSLVIYVLDLIQKKINVLDDNPKKKKRKIKDRLLELELESVDLDTENIKKFFHDKLHIKANNSLTVDDKIIRFKKEIITYYDYIIKKI